MRQPATTALYSGCIGMHNSIAKINFHFPVLRLNEDPAVSDSIKLVHETCFPIPLHGFAWCLRLFRMCVYCLHCTCVLLLEQISVSELHRIRCESFMAETARLISASFAPKIHTILRLPGVAAFRSPIIWKMWTFTLRAPIQYRHLTEKRLNFVFKMPFPSASANKKKIREIKTHENLRSHQIGMNNNGNNK